MRRGVSFVYDPVTARGVRFGIQWIESKED